MSVFLVTGASRGLGRSVVETALRAGHRVVAGVRDVSALDALAGGYPEVLAVVPLDVTDARAAERAVRVAVERFGGLDVVVNNAGYANVASIEDVDPEDFRAQVETNLFGVVTVTRAALPVLRRQGYGHVVQVSSVGGRMAT
ncbi:MAG: SDR family NAD(P)-dependent oxidoreductase, partial [Curtobacterium sp.]